MSSLARNLPISARIKNLLSLFGHTESRNRTRDFRAERVPEGKNGNDARRRSENVILGMIPSYLK
jgi:hypothetical protein